MIFIVGLGNPGKKYSKTRHNIGFRIIDAFAKKNGFPAFKVYKKWQALISPKNIYGKKIVLVKPQTFMNDSGGSIKLLMKKSLRGEAKTIWVIHDDIDLPLGRIKITKNRGAAGHKGVESIIEELKTKNFIRFRFGINTEPKSKNVEEFVLKNFSIKEEKIVNDIVEKTTNALEMALKEGLEKAREKYNKRIKIRSY